MISSHNEDKSVMIWKPFRRIFPHDETIKKEVLIMRLNRFLICLCIVMIGFFSLGFSQQSAEKLFQAGIYQEEVGGDLEEAIRIYQRIVKDFPNNREVAAKAQLQIGLCYEKLGLEGALKAYEDVISNYGEQKEVVAKAKIRLSKLARSDVKSKEPEGIRIRQLWKRDVEFYGTVSSDGRFLSYVDWGHGDIAIRNLTNGENQVLANEGTLYEQQNFALNNVISKNGKQIAYSFFSDQNTYDLHLVEVDNPSPRILYSNKDEDVYPVAWLSDKKLIVRRKNKKNKTGQIVSFDISDGTHHVLKTLEVPNWQYFSCSPDEKYIAYEVLNKKNNRNMDIHLLAIDGSSEISLVNHPANDRVLGWIPGRKEFLFLSDRSGTFDLWVIPVKDGKPSGAAKQIYIDVGEIQPMGFSENGDCFFSIFRRHFNTYIAPFNLKTGELKEKSGKPLLGSVIYATWSPDGQSLAFIREDGKADNPWQLTIQDLKNGEERKLATNLFTANSPCWSPDGKSILVIGRPQRPKTAADVYNGGIYVVDVKTGQTTEILLLSDYEFTRPNDARWPLSDIQWSLDGKSIFYLFFKDRLVKHDLKTGEEKILYKHSHFSGDILECSPDGKSLLFAVIDSEEKKGFLYTMSVEGGQAKELCTTQEAASFDRGMWSPDGQYIYFTEGGDGKNLWRIPSEGGNPQKVWHSNDRGYVWSIHPEGQQIAFTLRQREAEFRVIENLVQELEKLDKRNK